MPINSALFNRLQKKLGVTPRHVHRLIERAADRNHLPRNLAALLVASEHDIPVHQYATDEELAELRGLRSGVAPVAPVSASPAPSPRSVPAKPPKPTRNNSIFVVHGRDTQLTDSMYSFLRAIGINPMEWNEAIKAAKGGANPIVTGRRMASVSWFGCQSARTTRPDIGAKRS